MARACHRPARALALVVWAATFASSALAADVQYLVSARTELRTRNQQPGSSAPFTSELELLPVAGLLVGSNDTQLAVSYQPSLLLRPFSTYPVGMLQRGRLLFTETWERATLGATVDGAWGITDVSALRPSDSLPSGTVEVATAGVLPYTRLYGALSLDLVLDQRVRLNVTGGYQLSGTYAAPEGQELTLPLQWGPLASLRLNWTPGTRDTLTTSVLASDTLFSFGQRVTVVSGTQGWRRAFTARTALDVSAGAAFARTDVPDITNPNITVKPIPGLYREVLPMVSGTFSQRFIVGGTLDLRGIARMGPYADRYTGNVYERLEAYAQAQWSPTRTLQVTGNAGGGWAVNVGRAEQVGDRIVYGDGQVAWTAAKWLVLQGSARLAYSEQPSYNLRGWQWLLGVAVTVRDQGAL